MAKIKYGYEYKAKKKKVKNDFEKDFFKLMKNSVFSEALLTIEIRKTEILMNKSVYLDSSILAMSKTLMYE